MQAVYRGEMVHRSAIVCALHMRYSRIKMVNKRTVCSVIGPMDYRMRNPESVEKAFRLLAVMAMCNIICIQHNSPVVTNVSAGALLSILLTLTHILFKLIISPTFYPYAKSFASNFEYTMNTPTTSNRNISTVGVIGAGLSGIVAAAHLLSRGIQVTVFERGDSSGGAWKYNPQAGRDPTYPSIRPTTPDWGEVERLRETGLSFEDAAMIFDPPGPVYANMKGRNSEDVMRTSLEGWPEGKRAPLDHSDVVDYLQHIAQTHHVQEAILFRTRVESVCRSPDSDQWRVRTSKLVASSSSYELRKESWSFDGIVVASGRYGPPRVPSIPGLSLWKRKFPSRVIHASQFRSATPYRGRTVLIVGAFISALEITNELVKNDVVVYQSAKDTRVDFREKSNDKNVETVAMVAEFTIHDQDTVEPTHGPTILEHDSPIPGRALLQDGRIIENIHDIIIATGYLTTFPFLGPVLEQPDSAPEDADEAVVITSDARTVHNLHEDIFYIPDPSLAFIGVSHFASTFSLYDVQAQVLAAVFAGKVRLPPQAEMQAEQRHRKSRWLPGTLLNSIFLLDDFVISRLMQWANKDLIAAGCDPIPGPDPTWWAAFRKETENARSLLGDLQDNYLDTYGVNWQTIGRA